MRVQFSASLSVERGNQGDRPVDEVTDWIRHARDGDTRAFDRLMERHQSLCYHVAYRKLGDRESAAESCQEAMLSAWRRMSSFVGGPGEFRSWLVRIVVNECIDRLRYEARRPSTVSLDGDSEDGPRLELPPQPGLSVERLAEAQEMKARLSREIERVPEPYRTALTLHICEFTYAEIARTLGVDIGTVSSRLSRARGHLRAGLTSGGSASNPRSDREAGRRTGPDTKPPEAVGRCAATGS